MVTLFRKLLIRVGKVIPFVFAFIVVISHIESIYAVLNDDIILDLEGYYTYNVPISNYIGNIVYIDWFDVLLLYILAIALEFCWRNMLAVHYLLLNLAVRTLVEHFYIESGIVVGIASFMALAGLYCVYGGFKILLSK
jgi:glutaminase